MRIRGAIKEGDQGEIVPILLCFQLFLVKSSEFNDVTTETALIFQGGKCCEIAIVPRSRCYSIPFVDVGCFAR